MMILRNRRSGFTLIEIVVTLLVVSILFGLILGITQFSLSFFRDEESQITSQASLRLIATQFEKDVRKYVVYGVEFSQPDPNISEYRIAVNASTSIIYLFENNSLFRDGVLIGENVDDFNPNWDSITKSFDLNISSLEDGYGRKNQVSVRIFVRPGKGG